MSDVVPARAARVTRAMVADDLRPALRRVPPLALHHQSVRRVIQAGLRHSPANTCPGVSLEMVHAGPGLRVYKPETRTSRSALLWIHGGGFIIGSANQSDQLCSSTAKELGIVVVSTEYRLAPEHPFPAALDDCHSAWVWLQDHASDLGIDVDSVALGGQSAGGGLAASLAQRLRDSGGQQPAAQGLYYPMLDDRTSAQRHLDHVAHPVWNNKLNRFGWRSYLGAEPGGADVPPYAAPARRDDLSGLPPTWIGVGDIDLFHDEDHAYAQRLRAAGVPVTFDAVPGAPHGFDSWGAGASTSRDFVGTAQSWLARALRDRRNLEGEEPT